LERLGSDYFPGLTKHPIQYFRMFYADTALNGSTSALMCAYDFFGEDHILFGTDMPYDIENGNICINKTIDSINKLNLDNEIKIKIFEKNALKLLNI
jgi:aminocarboxymuconate-semialdehyde decarboxylase